MAQAVSSGDVAVSLADLQWVPLGHIGDASAKARQQASHALLVDAFMQDPMWLALLPDDATRNAFLKFLKPRRMRLFAASSKVLMSSPSASGDCELVGHAALCPPGDASLRPSFGTLMRAGFWQVPFRLGWKVFKAFDWLVEAIKKHQAEILDSHPDLAGGQYFTLQAMAISDAWRGRGVGSQMLGALLAEADAARLPTILLAQKERNLSFYGRLGFEVLDKRELAVPGRPGVVITDWIMVRKPAEAAAVPRE